MSESFNRTVETRLRAAVESAPSGLLMTDAEGRIVLVNREVERLFGYAREELLGQQIELLIPMRDRERHPDYRRGFQGDPRVRAMGAGRDLHGRRKDGVEVPVEVGLTPVATPDGLFVIGAVVDISARKAAEAEQRRIGEQLRQAQKLEAIGTLAGGIAHDFNNVLGAILGYAELLELELADLPIAREDAREIIVAAQRGRELVQQLLAFSRQQETARAPVEVPAIVQEVHQLLRASLPTSIQLSVISEPEVEPVLANATSLHRIVMNLATNAAHAIPAGGDVCIRVQRRFVPEPQARSNPELQEGWYTLLSVRDNGTGMDPDTIARAREPFFTTKRQGEGTGLGLSVVHGIMQSHGGALEIESTIGAGTEVRCYFPVLRATNAERATSA
jgi:PAS domain S-box-containing protein